MKGLLSRYLKTVLTHFHSSSTVCEMRLCFYYFFGPMNFVSSNLAFVWNNDFWIVGCCSSLLARHGGNAPGKFLCTSNFRSFVTCETLVWLRGFPKGCMGETINCKVLITSETSLKLLTDTDEIGAGQNMKESFT